MLTLITFLPLVGVLLLIGLPDREVKLQKVVALGVSLLTFAVSLGMLSSFRPVFPGMQFVEYQRWLPQLGIQYQVGVDGISLWLILLTTFLTPITLLGSWTVIQKRVKLFLIGMLVLEVALVGAFVSLNLFFFYLFWETMLIPMYLMIGVWGSGNRVRSANKFFLYTLVGSLLMLVAIAWLAVEHRQQFGFYSLYLPDLVRLKLSLLQQKYLFVAFFVAFAIKVPMFPFHTWLPDAHTDAPTPGSVILAGVMLKLGIYGIIRFAIPLFPEAAAAYTKPVMWLAVTGIIYGALVAWVQTDVKRLVAYSSVSHLGFILLGVFSATSEGVSGGILQMVNHGISTGALFLCIGILYERRHTREMSEYGGIASVMPKFALIFMISMLSSVGLPGLNGFAGEFPILLGTFISGQSDWLLYGSFTGYLIAGIAVSGVILGAVYLLTMYLKTMFGPVVHEKNKHLPDLTRRETAVFIPLIIAMFVIGLFPQFMYRKMMPSVHRFLEISSLEQPVRQGWQAHVGQKDPPVRKVSLQGEQP